MNKFEKLNITDKQKNIIEKYLTSLKNFVCDNNIDIEVYNDIEEMFFDKLTENKKLDDFIIKKSIKEVWKAEDIFWDFIQEWKSKTKNKNEFNFHINLIEKWWDRDNNWAILLWISKTLADKVWVSVLSIRILFLISAIFSIWPYFITAFILPIKWKNYYEIRTPIQFIKFQFINFIKDLIYNSTVSIKNLIKFIFSKSINIMKFISKNILPIFRFFIFNIIWFWFLSLLIFLLFVLWASFTDFSYWNIEFFSVFPSYFNIWIIFWIIFSSIFLVLSFLYWIKKKLLNNLIITAWFISFIVSLFFIISTWFDLSKKYLWEWNYIQAILVENDLSWTWFINIDISSITNWWSFNIFNTYPYINIYPSENWKLLLEAKRKILWTNIIVDRIKKNINPLSYKINNSNIEFYFKNNQVFKSEVPLTSIDTEIDLYLPIKNSYKINWYNYHFWNISAESNVIYAEYIQNKSCRYNIIYFSKEKNNFYCEVSEDDLNYAKEKYIINNLISEYENYSDLKHKEEFKRNYYLEYWLTSDWRFKDIKILEKEIYFEFFDQSIEIEANVWYNLTSTWITFNNFNISEIEANNLYTEKYYKKHNYNILEN